MNWQSTALGLAGAIGAGTAVVHGILTQRLMVRPHRGAFRERRADIATIRRVVRCSLHFSTIVWFLGGLALIAAALWFDRTHGARPACWSAAPSCWALSAISGRRAAHHPGWMLMAAAVILIAFALGTSGG